MSNGQIRPRTALDYLERFEIGTSLSVYLLQSIEGSTNKNQGGVRTRSQKWLLSNTQNALCPKIVHKRRVLELKKGAK
jgi:hypothetical protein